MNEDEIEEKEREKKVRDIFDNYFLSYLKKKNINTNGLQIYKKAQVSAGTSGIYILKNKNGKEFILKIVSTCYNKLDNKLDPTTLTTIAYNEIFSLYMYNENVPELKTVYEYKETDKDGNTQYTFFIIMKKYKTLGEIEIRSEADVYSILVDILHALVVLHSVQDFESVYKELVGETNLSFPENFLHDVEIYKRKNLLLHKDIKPINFLVDIDNNGEKHYLLADFGAVSFLDPNKQTNSLYPYLYTDPYVAPEFLTKPIPIEIDTIDVSSDIYSLGLTIKQILTTAQVASRHVAYRENFETYIGESKDLVDRRRPDHISREFWNILDKMTLRKGLRYKNADEVLADLETCKMYVSEEEFPREFIERSKLLQLVSENKYDELCEWAKTLYDEDSTNPSYKRLYAYVYNSNPKVSLECIKDLCDNGDVAALFLKAIILFISSGERTYPDEVKELLMRAANCEYIPAVYLLAREAKNYPNNSGVSNQRITEQQITSWYELLFEKEFVPGMESYLKILHSKHQNSVIKLSVDEKKERKEQLEEILKINKTNTRMAFFEYLY